MQDQPLLVQTFAPYPNSIGLKKTLPGLHKKAAERLSTVTCPALCCSFGCVAAHLPTLLERAMKRSDLTDTETKVWQAAATGTLVDLRVGDPKRDSPKRDTKWGPERTVRAEVIADLLLLKGFSMNEPITQLDTRHSEPRGGVTS
jgi:hypothetical protein